MNFERIGRLRKSLEAVDRSFHETLEINRDPVSLVLEFQNPLDREVTALIAAVFAYGNVRQIQNTLRQVFRILGPEPAQTIRLSTGSDWKKRIPPTFKHRFNTAEDLGILLTWMGEALRRASTLEEFFMAGLNTKDEDLAPLLEDFVERLTSLPCSPFKRPKSKGALFFFPRPSSGSACKRLLLFLRWVAGQGPMDVGVWKSFPRSLLLIPVDTHVLRISRHLGMTKRNDNSWRTAVEITNCLKLLDPTDPTRFDFALCHLGISKECPSRFAVKICERCRMNDLCVTYAKSKMKRPQRPRLSGDLRNTE
jgi:uncharacterized protein (TIGR02757 family)